MARFIEDRHELQTARRVADVRPWTARFAEVMSERFWLMVLTFPLIFASALIPLLAIPALGLAATLIVVHRNARPTLPLRYPKINSEPNPATGKPGDGILFYGNVDSTSPYEKFKELWSSDDDLRKHMLVIGSTGSGKSEYLKAVFFNALCWSSGYFVADGKADNKLPTDNITMVRSVGRDDDLVTLNFLLGGKTPEQVRRSRRRRTNKLNPFSSADADTIIQMGANMLPKVEGEGKNWQEKALNLWRAVVVALCYMRDTRDFTLSIGTIIDYLALPKIEELFLLGYEEAQQRNGEWSYGFVAIRTYLESGCPGFRIERLLTKHGLVEAPVQQFGAPQKKATEQEPVAFEQHAYRTGQLMPVLNLLDKTYGHIFRDRFSEIDMVDVTLNNRVMTMLIPSLEKSASEAENLGKLAVACLRVMMGRNLGADTEGSRAELLESKATNSPYPYVVALDELAYYFADGIAVIFAQARSLGFAMIAAAQDLEKLTEGSRAAEAGAMLANQVAKVFLRIDDAKKTWEFIQSILQKVTVALYSSFQLGEAGWRRGTDVDIREVDRVSLPEFQSMEPGQGVLNTLGKSIRFRSFYMDADLKKHRLEEFFVLRFLQVAKPTAEDIDANSIPMQLLDDPHVKGELLRQVLSFQIDRPQVELEPNAVIAAISNAARNLSPHVRGSMRAIALYEAAKAVAKAQLSAREAVGSGQGTPVGRGGSAMPETEKSHAGPEALLDDLPGTPTARTAKPVVGDAQPPAAARQAEVRPAQPEVQPEASDASAMQGLDLGAQMLEDLLPFTRKPVVELANPGDLTDAEIPAAAKLVGLVPRQADQAQDPATEFLSGMKFFSMPVVLEADRGKDPAQAVAEALLPAQPAPGGLVGEDWVAEALGSVNAAKRTEQDTAVGFKDQTLEGVALLETLLGTEKPAEAARKLEAVVSGQITPVVSPHAELDPSAIDALFADIDQHLSNT